MTKLTGTGPAIVLMVEDEPMIRMLGAEVLTHAGYSVIEAADAEAALQVLENDRQIRLLFTDINMPGELDGLALAHRVCLSWPDIRLLIVSGRSAPSMTQMPHCARFLPKPYELDELVELVRQILGPPPGSDAPAMRLAS